MRDSCAPLDLRSAIARVDGDEELLRDMAEIFLASCPEAISRIGEALGAGDARALAESAHGLKGSLANFGADRAVELAQHVETLGRTGAVRAAGGPLAALEREVAEVERALKTFVAQGSA
jgi:HPt (histidine-containing phosphotransfer) domain-containing protein